IVEDRGPRRHTLAELFGEALERRLRHSQCLEALMGERDAQPTRKTRLPPSVRRCHMREKAAQHLAPLRGVVDAKNDVLAGVRTRALPKYRCLYVAQIESWGVRHRPADFNLRVHCVPPVRASSLPHSRASCHADTSTAEVMRQPAAVRATRYFTANRA